MGPCRGGLVALAVGMVWLPACSSSSGSSETAEAGVGGFQGEGGTVQGEGGRGNGGSAGGATGGAGGAVVMKPDAGVGDASTCAAPPCGGGCDATKLDTDSHDCGACGHDCLGAVCAGGMCAGTALGKDTDIDEFVLDGDDIYIDGEFTLLSEPKSGGAFTTVYDNKDYFHDLRAQGGKLYFAADDGGKDSDGNPTEGLFSVPEGGGARASLFTGFDNPVNHIALTPTAATFLSWCSSVWTVPLAGGTPMPLTSTACNSFGDDPYTVDPSGTYGYAVDSDSDALFRVNFGTGAIEAVPTPFDAAELAVSADHVFFGAVGGCSGTGLLDASCKKGALGAIALNGFVSTWTADLASVIDPTTGVGGIGAIVVDDARLYVMLIDVGYDSSTIYSMPLTGGPLLRLAKPQSSVTSLAVDDEYVYFVSDDTMYRVPK